MGKIKSLLDQLNAIEKIKLKDLLNKSILEVVSSPNDNARIIEDNITVRLCPNCKNNMCKNGHAQKVSM